MQTLITIENVNSLIGEIISDIPAWRKEMIHYIKDENPELNTAIIELSQKTEIDPKALATGAYMAYKLIENELNQDGVDFQFDDEE